MNFIVYCTYFYKTRMTSAIEEKMNGWNLRYWEAALGVESVKDNEPSAGGCSTTGLLSGVNVGKIVEN